MILITWAKHLLLIMMKTKHSGDQTAILFYNSLRRRTQTYHFSPDKTEKINKVCVAASKQKLIMVLIDAANIIKLLGTLYLRWDARHHSYI